jgi:fructan beta-fructosidase
MKIQSVLICLLISQLSYTEQHRPQFHFSPDSMWMNDPNGMVFFK